MHQIFFTGCLKEQTHSEVQLKAGWSKKLNNICYNVRKIFWFVKNQLFNQRTLKERLLQFFWTFFCTSCCSEDYNNIVSIECTENCITFYVCLSWRPELVIDGLLLYLFFVIKSVVTFLISIVSFCHARSFEAYYKVLIVSVAKKLHLLIFQSSHLEYHCWLSSLISKCFLFFSWEYL